MANRPRRTRLYDTSYNIGQSYYQPTLDRLDRKAYGKAELPSTRALSPRPKFAVDDMFEDDLKTARRRAERAITEDGFLDIRNIKLPKPLIADHFDDEVESSLGRMRASKQMLSDMESSFDNTVLAVRKNRDDLTPLQGLKSLKLKVKAVDETEVANKWCRKTELDTQMEASSRARATKARLQDLESDMFDRTERQAARDRRLASVRQTLRDNDIDDTAFKALSLAEKHVSF